MDSEVIAHEFAELLTKMDRGGYLLVCAAIDAAGGELRIHPADFARRALAQPPEVEIDGTDGSVVLRVKLPPALQE